MTSWSLAQVAEHNSANSCWVIIKKYVYDVTEFLNEHPGGASIILKYAGKDATEAYEPIHPSDALEKNLPASKHLGPLNDIAAHTVIKAQENKPKTKDEQRVQTALQQRPPLNHILSLADMEFRNVTLQLLFSDTRVQYQFSSLELPLRSSDIHKVRPTSCAGSIVKYMAGEINLTRGAARTNIIQMVSSNASLSYEEIMAAAEPSQPIFFQLYKNINDSIAEKRVKNVERLGYKAIWLTVDALVPGNREKDIRSPWFLEESESGKPEYYTEILDGDVQSSDAGFGTAGALIANDDRDMTWEKARGP
ncbi:hypothetical protein C0992_005450 [Termitomyces sp. T32_za158]|nr:hypothetical protein C0992_005450 [Termitomyces sp. T32_za158]